MKRWEALQIFKKVRGDAVVVNGAGGMNEEIRTVNPSELNLYSPIPYPTSMGLGLAMALPEQKVVVMDGDGSALSGMTALPVVANTAPANLVEVVWDNGAYLSPGTTSTRKHHGPFPTPTAGCTDLEGLARASGFRNTCTVNTMAEFENAITEALAKDGLRYIVAKVDKDPMPQMTSKMLTTIEQAITFRRALINRGWLSPEHAGMSRGKSAPVDSRAGKSAISIPDIRVEPETGSRASLEKARIIYSSLREAGIDFFVYVPDSANYLIQRLASEDPEVTSIAVTREDDGLAIAMGAFMGGRNPVTIMEASGLGLCSLVLAVLAHEQRMATLILYAHHFALGESRDSHACTRWVTEPIFDALRIPHVTVMDVKDAPVIVKQTWRTVKGQMCPVAIGLPLHVIWDE
jgi:thiamine pyrophosphate-dependent acetolactate synthase large subunit-like protein